MYHGHGLGKPSTGSLASAFGQGGGHRADGWKVRFGWPASQPVAVRVPGPAHSLSCTSISLAVGDATSGAQRIKGGEVEGRAKDGTGGWDGTGGGDDPVHRIAARLIAPAIYISHARPQTELREHISRSTTSERSSSTSNAPCASGDPPGKMSWQTYVDDHLMCEIEGHHLTSAAIIGHDGTVWAQSAAFPAVSVLFVPLVLDFNWQRLFVADAAFLCA